MSYRHIRHLNPLKIHPERITKADKNMVSDLDYEDTEFPVSKKDFNKIEKKNNIFINVFCYEKNLDDPVYVSDEKLKNCMDLLMITDESKSHCVYIKDFNRFMCNKTKNKNKKHFCMYCLQCFSSERVLVEHKETFLKINGKQTVKLRNGSIKFKNYFKKFAIPFKIYVDFESVLKEIKSSDRKNNTLYTENKNIRNTFLAVLPAKLLVLMINLVNQLFFTGKQVQSIDLLKQFLKSIIIAKK